MIAYDTAQGHQVWLEGKVLRCGISHIHKLEGGVALSLLPS